MNANERQADQTTAIKGNNTSLLHAKKLLPRNCYLTGWHRCLNPNSNVRFSTKKNNSKEKGQQSCGIRKSIQAKWVQ